MKRSFALLMLFVCPIASTALAQTTLPDAPRIASSHIETNLLPPALLPGSITASAAANPTTPRPQGFLHGWINRGLVMGDFAVRMADATTTRIDLTGGCNCRESGFLMPNSIAGSTPAMFTFSAGISVGLDLGSRFAWNHGHHTLARLIPIGDIAIDGSAVLRNIRNYGSTGRP